MHNPKLRTVARYVIPAICSNVCFFLFTIVDAIFVGRGVGTNALGAVNLVSPVILMVGANETFHHFMVDYLFWYSIFIIPSGLSIGLQNYCRNDNAPGLVSLVVIITTICNIFGDWLFIFPFNMGTKGAAIATGVSQTIGLLILLTRFARKRGNLRFGRTKLNARIFRGIIVHGLPEGISQLSNPVMTLCMNYVLIQRIGDLGLLIFHGTLRLGHRHQYSAESCHQFRCDPDPASYFWRWGDLVLAARL